MGQLIAMERLKKLIPYNLSIGDLDNPDTHLVEVIEEWAQVHQYPAYYISTFGRCYKKHNKKETLLKSQVKDGYLIFVLNIAGHKLFRRAHRLLADTFIEKVEGKKDINHIDTDKTNNFIKNLEWCTTQENHKHADENGLRGGLFINGEKQKSATVLTEGQVIYIRNIYSSGELSMEQISTKINASIRVVRNAIRGKTWKEIPGAIPYSIETQNYNRKIDEFVFKEIMELKSIGYSRIQIAKKLKIDPSTINRNIKKYGNKIH